MTATSSGSRDAGPLPSRSPRKSSAISTTSASCPASVTAATTGSTRSGSVTTRLGRTWPMSPVSSTPTERGSTGTSTAPTSMRASQFSRYSGRFRHVTSTRSPGPTPRLRYQAAARSMRSRASPKVSATSSATSHCESGASSAACRNRVGMVRCTVGVFGTSSPLRKASAADSRTGPDRPSSRTGEMGSVGPSGPRPSCLRWTQQREPCENWSRWAERQARWLASQHVRQRSLSS